MRAALKKYEVFPDKEEYIRYTWISFATHIDKPRALWYAFNAKEFLDNQETELGVNDELLDKLYRKGLGYHVVAMAYVWNEWFEEAFAMEEYFMTRMYWHAFREGIEQYIEMLIVQRQEKHLAEIFADTEFRYCFLNHYEAYISLLIDPTLTITKMTEFVTLVNKINRASVIYGNGKKLY